MSPGIAPELTVPHTAALGVDTRPDSVGTGAERVALPISHLHPVGSADPAALPEPSGKEETWRFTPLRRLRGLAERASLRGLPESAEPAITAPASVTAHVVRGPAATQLKGLSGLLPTDRPAARAWQSSDAVLLVDIAADTVVDEPVTVVSTGAGVDSAIAEHVVIRVGRNAKAQVALRRQGSATVTDNVEIVLDAGASLEFVTLHEWAADTVHLSHHHLRVGRDATIRHTALTFGGDLVRVVTNVDYAGPGGNAELLGLYFADAGQHLEHRLFVDHAMPQCRSDALYKGALQGKGAHTVWVGDVLIRKAAVGTDTYEMNRNLVLSDGARADSIPNLEIETAEIIGAGHASTSGRFDDEQLFYLQARGIPEGVARRLVVRGYFGEVLLRIGIPEIAQRVSDIIESELSVARL